MKLKSIGAVALALSMLPSMVFGQGLMAKLKAKMGAHKAGTMGTTGTTASKPSMMGGMFHKKMAGGGSAMGGMMGMHSGSIIGNKNTKVYHMAGDKNLPDEKNRVYFSSTSAAEAAGYHASGSGGGSSMGSKKSSKMSKMSAMSSGSMGSSMMPKHMKKMKK